MTTPGPTALLVDDHPVFRSGLAVLLTAAGIQVVAETASGADAVSLARRHRPDVVIMDLGLPDIDGVRATEQLLAACPDSRVLVVTMYDDDGAVARALTAGARGYVLKDAPAAEVVKAVELVAAGAAVMGSGLASRVRGMVADGAGRITGVPARQFPQLTERERQVLTLLGKGLTNAVMAERLGVSSKTVANYVSAVLTRLELPDRAAAQQLLRDVGR
jgi:DNA-binding NarL/FixJ family response regulator